MDDQELREFLFALRNEVNGDMRQSVLLSMIEEAFPEDLSMWCAPGQSVIEMLDSSK